MYLYSLVYDIQNFHSQGFRKQRELSGRNQPVFYWISPYKKNKSMMNLFMMGHCLSQTRFSLFTFSIPVILYLTLYLPQTRIISSN